MTSLWALRILSRCLAASKVIRRSDGTLNRTVAGMMEWMASVTTKVAYGVSSVDVVVGSATGVWVRIFVPTSTQPETSSMPVVVYYHGGGFVFMKPDFVIYDRFCRRVAKNCRVVVVSVHYRRAPEHKFPAAYDDSRAVLDWLNSEKLSEKHLPASADLSRVFLAGDSAGGNIVHHVGIQVKNLDRLTIRGLILIQPFFGAQERTPRELQEKDPLIVSQELLDWFWKAFLPPGATRDHAASNVFGANSEVDISRVVVPPVIMFVGGRDILQDRQMRYAEDMKRAGKNVQVLFYDDGVHLMGHLDQVGIAEHMLTDIASFLSSHQD